MPRPAVHCSVARRRSGRQRSADAPVIESSAGLFIYGRFSAGESLAAHLAPGILFSYEIKITSDSGPHDKGVKKEWLQQGGQRKPENITGAFILIESHH